LETSTAKKTIATANKQSKHDFHKNTIDDEGISLLKKENNNNNTNNNNETNDNNNGSKNNNEKEK